MQVAQPLKAGDKNAVNIYDPSFDSNITFQAKLTDKNFCNTVNTVNIDGVSFCKDLVSFSFQLPCIAPGEYKLEFINNSDSSTIYELAANVY